MSLSNIYKEVNNMWSNIIHYFDSKRGKLKTISAKHKTTGAKVILHYYSVAEAMNRHKSFKNFKVIK